MEDNQITKMLKILQATKAHTSKHQYKSLKGQIKAGQTKAAAKGLLSILEWTNEK